MEVVNKVELEAEVALEVVTKDSKGCMANHQSANYVTPTTTSENVLPFQMPFLVILSHIKLC